MSAPSACCRRCAGVRLFHVTQVMDEILLGDSAVLSDWVPRPVGAMPRPVKGLFEQGLAPVGHWEVVVCRACGFTDWFAFDWGALHPPSRPRLCPTCETSTPHVLLKAVVNAAPHTLEQPRISRGLFSRHGFLDHALCGTCGHATWLARKYRHLTNGIFRPHRLVADSARPCLACGAADALLAPTAVPVAVTRPVPRWFLSHERVRGRYALRVCRPCGVVEWYAQALDAVRADPTAGVFALGDDPEPSRGGPYR